MGDSERVMQRSIWTQLLFVLIGALILFLCIVAMFTLWSWNNGQTGDALDTTAMRFRDKQFDKFSSNLEALLRPIWTIARRTAFDMQSAVTFEGSPVFPLSVHTFNNTDQMTALARYFYPKVARVTNDGGNTADTFIGQVAMIGLDNESQPTHVPAKCVKLVILSQLLDKPQGNGYNVGNQFLDENGTQSRRYMEWDPVTMTIGRVVKTRPVLPCPRLMSFLWNGIKHPGPVFANFSWFGPVNPGVGWGNHQGGSVPIYDNAGNHVGRFSTLMSLGNSVGPMLDEVMRDGGDLLKGGEAVIFEMSSKETVLGLSEGARRQGSKQEQFLREIKEDTEIYKAIKEINNAFGSNCPSTKQRLDLDERLIDVVPFTTEQYGMPPLPSPWCLLMTIPRKNVYGPMDTAATSAIAMFVTAIVGIVLAFLLLGRSVFNARNAQLKMTAERKAGYQRRIQKADDEVQTLNVPMAVMHWSHFNAMEVLQCFEDLRDAGKLIFFDSVRHVRQFQDRGKLIVMISHQWLGYTMPDTLDCIQLRAMQQMVAQIVTNEDKEDLYVWLDYISVPQRHAGMQALSINSLPAYVSMADRFVICAPDARHRDDPDRMCNVESYARRGWCRTEMLAKACSSGLQHMYLCGGNGSQLQPLAKEDFQRLSLSVFKGDFTIRTDMEKLVEPAIGLYGLILKSEDEQEHIKQIKAHIEEDKDNFFPKEYSPDLDMPNQKRMLFGPLIGMMEEHVSGMVQTSAPREDKLRGEDIKPSTQVGDQRSAWSMSIQDPVIPSSATPMPNQDSV